MEWQCKEIDKKRHKKGRGLEMEDKIQTGLRIPENQYNRIKERADRMGVSINQLILVLVDIGINCLDKEQSE